VENDDAELPQELREFIDRLIVPLLVERLTRHLYRGEPSDYDENEGLTPAA